MAHHHPGEVDARSRRVTVVGGGVMGAATAWMLARRGAHVVLHERFARGHHEGASHGETRNFNTAYSSEVYLDLVFRARDLWAELEQESGVQLLDRVGLVNHGGGAPRWGVTAQRLAARGEAARWMSAAQAQERWPALRFRPHGSQGQDVLFVPSGARVRAAAALEAFYRGILAHGGQVRFSSPVDAILPLDGGGVRVQGAFGTEVSDSVVIAAGAWTSAVAGALVALPDLVVTQEQPAHFGYSELGLALGLGTDLSGDSDPDGAADLPGFNHSADPDEAADGYFRSDVYGMRTPGEGIKAGWHGTGPCTDPDDRSYAPEPDQLADLQRYASEWIPGARWHEPTPISCTYTSTATTDFILDRVGDVVIGAGFSGHGYKFAPAIGEVLANLALAVGKPPAGIFALRGR